MSLMRWTIHRWLLMGWVLLFAATASAASTNSGWSLHVWRSEDGLPNNNVTGLAQTPDRYLWVANASRLSRFDGVQFETFPPGAVVANWTQRIHLLLRSRNGGLWLATDHGAVAFLKDGQVQLFTNDLPEVGAQTLTEDDDRGLWVTYNPGIICRIKDGRAANLGAEAGLPPGDVSSLARDNRGRMWFAQSGQGDGHVGLFHDGRFETLLHFGSAIIRITSARSGGIWICSGFHLFKYNVGGQLADFGTFTSQDSRGKPNVLLEDRRDALWLGTSDSGLFRFDGSTFEKVPTSHPEIADLREDRDGNLWVATAGGGLNRLRPRAIELECVQAAEHGLPFETVISLCEDTNGVLWGATQNGVLTYRTNGAWNTFATNADWPGGEVSCVAADRKGAVWIGTKNHALYRFQDGRFTAWRKREGLAGITVRSLLASSTGDLWIGQDARALQCLRNGQLRSFDVPGNVRHVRALAEDPQGNIWVGTSGGLILKITHDRVTDVTSATSLDGKSIRCLYATPDGSIWVGYASAGLGRFKDGHFTRITSAQGLYDDSVSQIVADEQGWLWFGTDRGIFKIKQEMLKAVAEGRAQRVRCTYYGQDEGLVSLQANFDVAPGAIRSRDGRLWIPMRTALASINPGELLENRESPPVLLRRIAMDGKTIGAYGGVMPVQGAASLPEPQPPLLLPPRHHKVEFNFTAFNFSAPENVHFRYRLEGFDENWSEGKEADTLRTATYPQLSAGDYRFRVAACNSDGVWNQAEVPLSFGVARFFWQTWWFRAGAILAFTLMVATVVRYVSFRRLRLQLRLLEQQAALDKERSRIARDLHDDLGGSLTEVSLLLGTTERALTGSDKVNGSIQQCSSLVQQITKSVDEIIWAINPRNDTLRYLIDYISQFVVEFLHAANIRCRVDLPEHIPDRTLSPEARHNLFLVVKETLNNIARHSRASEVRLRITTTEDQLNISIEDTGQGFNPPPESASADGLRNMRQRMEEIGGEFQLDSRPDAGTRVHFLYHYPHHN
jgi:ligand-binding sensor domain-containing protein/signal transduction histidine kinase